MCVLDMKGYPTSYTLAEQWMNYFSAVETLKSFEEMGLRLEIEQEDALFEKIGVLGSPGFAVGAFLTTPYTNDSAPDIQITVYPTVRFVSSFIHTFADCYLCLILFSFADGARSYCV